MVVVFRDGITVLRVMSLSLCTATQFSGVQINFETGLVFTTVSSLKLRASVTR